MTFPTFTETDRAQMWVNFLNHCRAGTILTDFDGVAWQKARGCGDWLKAGSEGCTEPTAIPWPMVVLYGGIG